MTTLLAKLRWVAGGLVPSRAEFRRGNAARDARDWGQAALHYREALRRAPHVARCWVQLGHVLKEQGDLAGAEDAYRTALAQAPGEPDTLHHLGHVVGRLGRQAESLRLLGEAAQADPPLPAVLIELARLGPAGEAVLRRQFDAFLAAGRIRAALALLLVLSDPPEGAEERLVALAADQGGITALEAACRAAEPDHEASAAPMLAFLLLRRGAVEEAQALLAEWTIRVRQNPDDFASRTALRGIRLRLNRHAAPAIVARHQVPPARLPASLDFVCFGTTGLCNASCIHCPTGKETTAHVPRTPMPLPLMRRILEEMAALNLTVRRQVSLGLFGDGLVDPHVVERVRLIREVLPEVTISVNTNGAAYDPRRHRALFDLTSQISVHVESLRPETYDVLMAPLRAARVLPKIEALLRDFPGKVHVSIPVNRLNLPELSEMRRFFMARGATGVGFDGLSSRCAVDRTVFNDLALDPKKIACRPGEVSDNLIVDSDGQILACCSDFQRIEPIGDLSRQSLLEALLSPERALLVEQMAEGRHDERATCRRCFGDMRVEPLP